MAGLDNGDQMGQLWALIQELSEQLNQNRNMSVSLLAQADKTKTQATHTQTGFVLRRFNTDKSIEEYEAELERMNASILAENRDLQYDNKQLNALIREYEQTLENVMSNFRNRAQDVQERELSLIREYEMKLLARQEEHVTQDLALSSSISESLVRLSNHLRQFLRSLQGEEPSRSSRIMDSADEEEGDFRDGWTSREAGTDQALEREIELARLERENGELRRMLGLIDAPSRSNTDPRGMPFDLARLEQSRPASAAKVGGGGVFSTYKPTRPLG